MHSGIIFFSRFSLEMLCFLRKCLWSCFVYVNHDNEISISWIWSRPRDSRTQVLQLRACIFLHLLSLFCMYLDGRGAHTHFMMLCCFYVIKMRCFCIVNDINSSRNIRKCAEIRSAHRTEHPEGAIFRCPEYNCITRSKFNPYTELYQF